MVNLKKAVLAGCVLTGLVTMQACSSSDSSSDSVKLSQETGTCFGRVIDRSTRSGISGAVVEIFAGAIPSSSANESSSTGSETNFVARTTTGSDDADTTLWSEAGMWRIENLPTNANSYRVRIGADGYATLQTTCTIGNSLDNTPVARDIGDMALVRAKSLVVNLFHNGTGLSGCPVYAFPPSNLDPSLTAVGDRSTQGGVEVVGTTDANGAVTLAGLNPLLAYTVIAPACDTNADNVYDYITTMTTIDSLIDTDSTLQIQAVAAVRDEALSFVDTNASIIANGTSGFPGIASSVGGVGDIFGIGSTTNLVLVFNYPVSIVSSPGISLVYDNNLIASSGVTGFPVLTSVAAECALSAGNTVLTCNPASDLPTNEILQLVGTVAANVPSTINSSTVNDLLDLSDLDFDGTIDGWYVSDTSSSGLSATTTITADNYNNTADGSGADDLIYLEFPEFVYGTWTVVSTSDADPDNDGTTTDAITTSFVPGCSGDLSTLGSFLYEGNDPTSTGVLSGGSASAPEDQGCTAGTCPGTRVVYRVPLNTFGCGGPITLRDNESGAARTVNVYVDATDIDGNRRQGLFSLPVE